RTGDFHKSFVVGPPESVFTGPILTGARYPDVLVARAFSDGEDLHLVLYPGAARGPQKIVIERLKPSASYELRGARETTFQADGRATLSVAGDRQGRTPLHVGLRG